MSASEPTTQRFSPVVAGPTDVTLTGGGGLVAITSTPLPPPRDRLPHVPGYAFECELGRGGMGVVYRAKQERLNRTVAVKMLLHPDGGDASDLLRFRSEAEAVAAIAHPHVVKVFESGQADGRPYFAMEHLPGGTLHARVKANGPFPPDEAAVLVEKLARAVHAAHSIGIVHRDLKPGNVLFDAAGEPKVTDFGLAKRVSCELTRTQAVMGTPAYMPPEQAAGRAKYVGPPADIYALGVILYECLTGTTPFQCEDSLALLNQVIADEPPSIRKKAPGVSRDLELICFKCLEKGPIDRYQTAAELADDLRRFADREPVSVRPAGPIEKVVKWAKRRPTLATAYGLGVLAAVLLLFGGGAAVLAVEAAGARDAAEGHRREAELARDQLASQADVLEAARAAADGHWRAAEMARDELAAMNTETLAALDRETTARKSELVALGEANKLREEAARTGYYHNVGFAYREMQEGNFVRARQLLDECPERLRGWEWRHVYRCTHPQVGSGVNKFLLQDMVLTEAGKSAVASTLSGGVTRFDFTTGKGAMIPEDQTVEVWSHTRLSDDASRMLVVTHAQDDARGGERVRVVEPLTGKRLGGFAGLKDVALSLHLSGDGRRAFVQFGRTFVCYDLSTWTEVGRHDAGDESLTNLYRRFRPRADGAEIALVSGFEVRVWNGGSEKPTETFSAPYAAIPTTTALTDDGKTLVVGMNDGTVVLYDRKAKKPVEFRHAHAGYVLALTVFGNKLAATAGEDGVVNVWDLATGRLRQTLVGLHGKAMAVRFDADGQHVLVTDDSFMFNIFSLSEAFGSRYPLWVTEQDGLYTADNQARRYFSANGPATTAVVWNSEGMEWNLTAPAEQGFTAAAFSPVGRGLAVGTTRGLVEWRDDPAAEPRTAVDLKYLIRDLQFTPDGKRLFASSGDLWAVWDTKTKKVVQEGTRSHDAAALSPDGKWVAIARSDERYRIDIVGLDGGVGGSVVATEQITTLAFSPDGTKLLAACGRRGISEFPLPKNGEQMDKPTRTFSGHVAQVSCLGFSPDGKRMVSGSTDGRVKVWDFATGVEAVGMPLGRKVEVSRVWFTQDGHQLLAGTRTRPPVLFEGRPRPPGYKPPRDK